MELFIYHLKLCLPLFILVFAGWAVMRARLFNEQTYRGLAAFTFRLLMPALLFDLMSDVANFPPINAATIVVFGSSCVMVFMLGRLLGRLFGLDNTGKTIFGMAAIFGNNVQLGVPIVQVSLGEAAIPTLSLIVIFSVLTMWTTAIACVEFGKTDSGKDLKKIAHSMLRVFKNPIVLAILLGSAFGFTGITMPEPLDRALGLVSSATTPIALMVVGMGLAQHSFTAALPAGLSISALKIVVQPTFVYALSCLFGLGELETATVTLASALPVAINVFMMSADFKSQEAAASNAILMSTLLSAVVIPIVLTLLGVQSLG